MYATERRSLTEVITRLEDERRYALTLSRRLEAIPRAQSGRRTLEIGAAAGGLTIALNELGYFCTGVEPDEYAIETAQQLACSLGRPCRVRKGCAEALPFTKDSFDIVIANSVFEHVSDIDLAFSEAARVLVPGGLLWFQTASSMCPFQHEIGHFPFFGWYPDSLKVRIMKWAVVHRPKLVGQTRTPAINWFTDAIAQRKLVDVGFSQVWDRWDLRRGDEGRHLYSIALQAMKSNRWLRRLANVVVSECAYAACKNI
jgi:SAM-dependent methyltransferase